MKTSEIVKNSKTTSFQYYRESNFYFKTDNGFEFPIPLEDVAGATILREDKTIFFMRWIRKHVDTINQMPEVADALFSGVKETV